MNLTRSFIFALVLFSCADVPISKDSPVVKTGAEQLIENHLDEISDYRIGLVMNPTARINGVHVLDTLLSRGANVTALFAPEHGFRGTYSAGEHIEDGIDTQTGLPVFSLYGATRIPTAQMLSNVDILLFDMQDVGARFYTYNSTMKTVIEAASEFDKEVWILDRPNPAGGLYVSGWVRENEFISMVGSHPIPIAHGLTLGELALMGIGEQWYRNADNAKIKIIEMEGWRRDMLWSDTGLPWIAPSPNLPSFEHAHVYLGTCLIEGVTLSEGRGTDNPFLTIGGPDLIVPPSILQDLAKTYHLKIDTVTFTPISIPGKARFPKHEGVELNGISIDTTPKFSKPVEFGLELLYELMRANPSVEKSSYLYMLAGTTNIDSLPTNFDWGKSFEEYLEQREKYLLY